MRLEELLRVDCQSWSKTIARLSAPCLAYWGLELICFGNSEPFSSSDLSASNDDKIDSSITEDFKKEYRKQ
jgi:hypothetical protein